MKRLKQSILWGMLHSAAGRVLQFVGTLVLARLLVPEAFGLFATAQGVTMLLGLVISAGWLQPLVRRKEEDASIYNAVFTFQLVLCLIAWVGLWSGAPLLSSWLGDERLKTILPILGLTLFGRPIFIYHTIFLHRGMQFKSLAKINITIAGLSLAVTIFLAISGMGVWSLILGRITNAVLLGVLVSRATGKHPKLEFDFSRLIPVMNEAYRFAMLKGIDHVMVWGPYALVSRLHGAGDVGYLQRGISTAQMPVEISAQAVNAPLFRAYAATEDGSQREYYLLRALSAWILYMWPIAWLLHAYPDIIISVMYGPQWEASIPLLAIYALYLFFVPFQSVSRNYITSSQGPGVILKLQSVMLGVLIMALLVFNENLLTIAIVILLVASMQALWTFGIVLMDLEVPVARLISICSMPAVGVLVMMGIWKIEMFSRFSLSGEIIEMCLAILVYGAIMLLYPGRNLEAGQWRNRLLRVAERCGYL